MQSPFPSGPIPAVDPLSNAIVDVRSLLVLLHGKYNGDKELLVGELQQLANYLMREPGQQQCATQLRRMFNLVSDIAAAIDSVRVIPLA